MNDPEEFSTDGCLIALIRSYGALWLWRLAGHADREWSDRATAAAAQDDERFERLLAALREGSAPR